ncbi:MAG: tRNA dihydrouridine(20/20a) synthase DusA, partial [Myxococcota bacterium]|nr:tRNA dihydrouridine(20/20a) synthase DusA [Myxococcota bacterium]
PMMQRTDRHFRVLLRQITRHTLLYTEMVTTGSVIHGDRDYLLGYDAVEHPIAIQLGGDDPGELAQCARIAVDLGYDEVNLNVGCPSDRVQSGQFGVCLMFRPERVAEAVAAMRDAVDVPITVKHRIGVDDLDRYEDMARFVEIVAKAGCDRFSVHARKAWLDGLSPKENRTVPPLRYEDVHRLKREFPHLVVEINGGFIDLTLAHEQLEHVDAVMIGRAAYEDPYSFALADSLYFDDPTTRPTRQEVVHAMVPTMESWLAQGGKLHAITRHMLTLFRDQPGAKRWRQVLSDEIHRPGATIQTVLDAIPRAAAEQGALHG